MSQNFVCLKKIMDAKKSIGFSGNQSELMKRVINLKDASERENVCNGILCA